MKLAWDSASTVGAVGGLLAAAAVWYRPGLNEKLGLLVALLTAGAFVGVLVLRLIQAPYALHRELSTELASTLQRTDQTMAAAEERARTAEATLADHRNYQGIADYLTSQHHYGVHQLLNQPPQTVEELPEWDRRIKNWNEALFLKMRGLGCTAQEINHVETITSVEVAARLPELPKAPMRFSEPGGIQASFARHAAQERRTIEASVQMHAIRLARVASLSTKYAEWADALRLPGGTRRG